MPASTMVGRSASPTPGGEEPAYVALGKREYVHIHPNLLVATRKQIELELVTLQHQPNASAVDVRWFLDRQCRIAALMWALAEQKRRDDDEEVEGEEQ